MNNKQTLLASIPSVDEILRSSKGRAWLAENPRRLVLWAVKDCLFLKRRAILEGAHPALDRETLYIEMEGMLREAGLYKLRPVINGTGIVVHTNLGRSLLSEDSLQNLLTIAGNYSNLEFHIVQGKRGKRYSHITGILKELTGAEDAVVVNNNAAAVFLSLNTLSKGKEVICVPGRAY